MSISAGTCRRSQAKLALWLVLYPCAEAPGRRALQTKLLRYLVAVGALAAKGNTELAAQFRLPNHGTSSMSFPTTAREMLEKATAQKDLLVSRGMWETLLDDLAAAIGEFEQTLEATREGRRDHVGASADLEAVAAEIAEQVRFLPRIATQRAARARAARSARQSPPR